MIQHQTLAYSELRALMTKAARGAGLPWGLAEEAGWAADWLARWGLPAADLALPWLEASAAGSVGPVETGTALADRLAKADGAGWFEALALPDDLPSPAYLLPFLHQIAQSNGPVALMAAKGLAALVPVKGPVSFGPFWCDVASGWTLIRVNALASAARPVVSAATLAALESHALRTTVPASDQSRRGAGATASDND